jgi:hypothetical protein
MAFVWGNPWSSNNGGPLPPMRYEISIEPSSESVENVLASKPGKDTDIIHPIKKSRLRGSYMLNIND